MEMLHSSTWMFLNETISVESQYNFVMKFARLLNFFNYLTWLKMVATNKHFTYYSHQQMTPKGRLYNVIT